MLDAHFDARFPSESSMLPMAIWKEPVHSNVRVLSFFSNVATQYQILSYKLLKR